MAHAMPQVPGVDHRFVAAGDVNLHVAEAGEGEPVLLLHGWPEHWYSWRLVIPALASRHRVLAVDLRGFGWSDIAWTGFEKEAMADDVVNLLDALDLERVNLVGHDWGGWIGYLLALRRPDLVTRLVTLNVPPPWLRPTLGNLLAMRRLRFQLAVAAPFAGPKLVGNRVYVVRKLTRGARQREHLGKRERRLYARDLHASTRARAATLLYRTWLTRELLPVMAGRYRGQRLTVPTLVLHGAEDRTCPPRLFRGIEDAADDLRTREIPGAGHFLPEEAPETVAEAILDFLEPAERESP